MLRTRVRSISSFSQVRPASSGASPFPTPRRPASPVRLDAYLRRARARVGRVKSGIWKPSPGRERGEALRGFQPAMPCLLVTGGATRRRTGREADSRGVPLHRSRAAHAKRCRGSRRPRHLSAARGMVQASDGHSRLACSSWESGIGRANARSTWSSAATGCGTTPSSCAAGAVVLIGTCTE